MIAARKCTQCRSPDQHAELFALLETEGRAWFAHLCGSCLRDRLSAGHVVQRYARRSTWAREWAMLGAMWRRHKSGMPLWIQAWAHDEGVSLRDSQRVVQRLQRQGLVRRRKDVGWVELTPKGLERCEALNMGGQWDRS